MRFINSPITRSEGRLSIIIQVTRWNAQIGPLLEVYTASSPREIYLDGSAQFNGWEKTFGCRLSFIHYRNIRTPEYGKWWLSKNESGESQLHVKMHLVDDVWNEIWERSKAPPPGCTISFEMNASLDEALATRQPLLAPTLNFISTDL